jgi:hypothetical protein
MTIVVGGAVIRKITMHHGRGRQGLNCIFFNTLDSQTIVVNAETGKEP